MLLLLGIFSLSVHAFTLSVNCPSSVNAGDTVTCSVVLNEQITSPDVFGEQFRINAPGFTISAPFVEGVNGVQAFNNGGIGGVTVLLRYSEGQNAGQVAAFYLVAGNVPGTYTVSLSEYYLATNIDPVTIVVVSSVGASSQQETIGTAAAQGGSDGGGGSSSAVSSSQGIVNPEITSGNVNPEIVDVVAESAMAKNSVEIEERKIQQQQEISAQFSGTFPWRVILIFGILSLMAIIVFIVMRYVRSQKILNEKEIE